MRRNAKILLIVSGLFTFSMGLSNIFISVFFWKQTNDFVVIALYNLIINIITPIVFVFSGLLSKKKNGVLPLRIGLVIYALFYSLILYAGNKGVIYIYALGVINGIASGFYWLSFNVLSFNFTNLNNRDTFNGFNGCFTGIASIVGPISAAFIISRFKGMLGYRVVFGLSFAIFIVIAFISVVFKADIYHEKLDFKKALLSNSDEWRVVRKSTFFWGLRDSVMLFIVNILAIQILKSELNLGKFAFIAAIIASVSYVLVQKIIKPGHRKISVIIGTSGMCISILILALNISFETLLIYAIIDAFCMPFFIIQLSSATFNVIDANHDGNKRIEYMINRDIVLNGGRAISTGVLIILFVVFKNMSILRIYLIFLSVVPLASGYFLRKLKEVE